MDIFFSAQPKPPKRDKQLKIMVAASEKARLDAAAHRLGITSSDLVREAVNEYMKKRKKTQQ